MYVILPPPLQPSLPQLPYPKPENVPAIFFLPEVIVKLPPNAKGALHINVPLPVNVPGYGPRALPLTLTLPQPLPLPLVEVSFSAFLMMLGVADVEFGPNPPPCDGVTLVALLQLAKRTLAIKSATAFGAKRGS
ncbi:MAG: hypothetical protein WB615_00155 [Candidatus Tumulicola sp.]